MPRTEPFLIAGGRHDFVVEPLFTRYLLAVGKARPKQRIPGMWSNSPCYARQRPAFWMVRRSPKEVWFGEEMARFRTLKAATAEAERLAAEDKTLALLKGG